MSYLRATVVNGRDVRRTLDRACASGRTRDRLAGSFVTRSTLPQALIQCRQRLKHELRLRKLVILSRSVPKRVAGDSVVAQPTTGLSPTSSAPSNQPAIRRHTISRYTDVLHAPPPRA